GKSDASAAAHSQVRCLISVSQARTASAWLGHWATKLAISVRPKNLMKLSTLPFWDHLLLTAREISFMLPKWDRSCDLQNNSQQLEALRMRRIRILGKALNKDEITAVTELAQEAGCLLEEIVVIPAVATPVTDCDDEIVLALLSPT